MTMGTEFSIRHLTAQGSGGPENLGNRTLSKMTIVVAEIVSAAGVHHPLRPNLTINA